MAKVGEALHLSPSDIFCQIRELEDELRQKLYERFGKRRQLTESGMVADYGIQKTRAEVALAWWRRA